MSQKSLTQPNTEPTTMENEVGPSVIGVLCEGLLEAGWLLSPMITTVFFNPHSSRVFDTDKYATLRALATVMVCVWLVRLGLTMPRREVPRWFSWHTPLVLPTMLIVVTYWVSSIFSLHPYISFMGAYGRLQGTYTFVSCVVVFFSLLTALRTRFQLSRLLTVLIVSSVPVALYAIQQHLGFDPLPWACGNCVASTLGNVSYLAGYLALMIPLTLARLMESGRDIFMRGKQRGNSMVRTLAYLSIATIQGLALYYIQSRLQSRVAWFALVIAIFFFMDLHLIVRARWRYGWIAWACLGVLLLGFVIGVNVPGALQEYVRHNVWLHNVTQISELQEGRGKVYRLIWQSTWELISPHEPLLYPDGHKDVFNVIRPLIGYGPETMALAYPRFYTPELAQVESRTATPDRAKNAVLDVLVTRGMLGLIAYLMLFGSVFYWSLHWLGLIVSRRQRWLFGGVNGLGMVIAFIVPWWCVGPYLMGITIPLGMLGGTWGYITWRAYRISRTEKPSTSLQPPHADLLIGILSSVVAYFITTNIGNVISSTQLIFWILMGLLVVLGKQWISDLPAASL